jgi:hypothetical protein
LQKLCRDTQAELDIKSFIFQAFHIAVEREDVPAVKILLNDNNLHVTSENILYWIKMTNNEELKDVLLEYHTKMFGQKETKL